MRWAFGRFSLGSPRGALGWLFRSADIAGRLGWLLVRPVGPSTRTAPHGAVRCSLRFEAGAVAAVALGGRGLGRSGGFRGAGCLGRPRRFRRSGSLGRSGRCGPRCSETALLAYGCRDGVLVTAHGASDHVSVHGCWSEAHRFLQSVGLRLLSIGERLVA